MEGAAAAAPLESQPSVAASATALPAAAAGAAPFSLSLNLPKAPEPPVDQYERDSLVLGCAAHLRALVRLTNNAGAARAKCCCSFHSFLFLCPFPTPQIDDGSLVA
jgi:hypothetical protein